MSQKSDPLISVLLPVKTGIEYLPDAVQSVLGQTYENLELLIGVNNWDIDPDLGVESVPGCRTENLYKFRAYHDFLRVQESVSRFKDPRLHVYMQRGARNLPESLNGLVANSIGDWIARIDADDTWRLHKLERQVPHLSPRKVVGTWGEYTGEKSGLIRIRLGEITREHFVRTNHIINSSSLFPREAAWWDPSSIPVDDYDQWLRLAFLGYSFFNVPEALVTHRVWPGSAYNTQTTDLDALRRKWKLTGTMGELLPP